MNFIYFYINWINNINRMPEVSPTEVTVNTN